MNSSGMKRGLATVAVSALAVTGLPFLASTAHAAPGDAFTVTSIGPALNGGAEGAVVTIRFKDGQITPSAIKAVGTSGNTTGTEDTADQTVQVVSAGAAYNDTADSTYDFVDVRVSVTTSSTGGTASFRLFEDDGATANTLEASEARQPVSISTSGAPASVEITPNSQSTAQGIQSGAYTLTLKDAAGRTTQLTGAQNIDLKSNPTGVNFSQAEFDVDDLAKGSDTFTATHANVGTYTITAAGDVDEDGAGTDVADGPAGVSGTATLNVTKAATLSDAEVDIVTGADDWNGFGGDAGAGNTLVGVDQGSIRIDFKSTDAAQDGNSTVTLTLTGGGIKFGGKDAATVSTVLDANGVGSITITPDAGTVQDGDTIAITGSFAETLEFDRARETSIKPTSSTFFSKLDSPVDVTATVLDQFGRPITTGFVEAQRTGASNVDTTWQRKAVGNDGKVTFTFTDKDAVNGGTDNVEFRYFEDGFDSTGADLGGDATIKYTTDGMGANYVASLDGMNTEAADYDATDVVVVPLSDTVADNDGTPATNESADLAITGGEGTSEMTISVDNGAKILKPTQTKLSEGSESVTVSLVAGALPNGYKVIGTKSGVVTVTMSSAGRTETAQLTIGKQTDLTQARNVSVSGPAEVENGTNQITYTAVVTDAFGNPIPNFKVTDLNVQVTGPAQYQDGDAVTNAAGQLNLNVRVDNGAEGTVGIRVQGLGSQFGAAKDRLSASSSTDDGKGLDASSNVANASTTVKAAEPVDPPKDSPELELDGNNNGGKADRLKVSGLDSAEGAQVNLFRKTANGWKKVREGFLNSEGNTRFRVRDLNGKGLTLYKAVVKEHDFTLRDKDTKKVR